MAYPALTFCRDPPYKLAALQVAMKTIKRFVFYFKLNTLKFQKYNLSHHPKHTPFWRFFPFDRVNLDDFFEEIVYSREETFAQYALDGQRTSKYLFAIYLFLSIQIKSMQMWQWMAVCN